MSQNDFKSQLVFSKALVLKYEPRLTSPVLITEVVPKSHSKNSEVFSHSSDIQSLAKESPWESLKLEHFQKYPKVVMELL